MNEVPSLKTCLDELHATHKGETQALHTTINELRVENGSNEAALSIKKNELQALADQLQLTQKQSAGEKEAALATARAAHEADIRNHNTLLAEAQRKLEKCIQERESAVDKARAEAAGSAQARIAQLEIELERARRLTTTGPQVEIQGSNEEKAMRLGALEDEKGRVAVLSHEVAELNS